MAIRHTVIFKFYESSTRDQIDQLISRLGELGRYNTEHLGVISWVVREHITETHKEGRADLLEDGIFPDIDSLIAQGESKAHQKVVELASKISDWEAVDTEVPELGETS